jgi:tripartite-type tricarboxylate transporter receptor subunit TctC
MLFRAILLALSLCAIAPPASAADYPDHAIRKIVPFAAGGGTDVLARVIADNLNKKWGQPVIAENQPGASGAIGTRAAMRAPPDGTQRSKFYPEVPTVADAVSGYESVGWFGLLAPPNTLPAIVKEINEVIVAAMQTPAFRDHLATLGAEPRPQTPEEFGRYINADVAKWSKLVKDNGVQLPGGK